MKDYKTEDDFDIEQSNKLIKNIRIMGDIRNINVQKPDSVSMETTSLKGWLKWLIKRVETYGDFGVEMMFISIIKKIDNTMQLMTERAEESVRRLLNVIDRQSDMIGRLKDDIKNQNIRIDKLIDALNGSDSDDDGEDAENGDEAEGKDDNNDANDKPKKKRGKYDHIVTPAEYEKSKAPSH